MTFGVSVSFTLFSDVLNVLFFIKNARNNLVMFYKTANCSYLVIAYIRVCMANAPAKYAWRFVPISFFLSTRQNIKFSHLIKHNAMKKYQYGGIVPPILNIGTRLR